MCVKLLALAATMVFTMFVGVSTAAISCPAVGDSEALEAATVQATAIGHAGHSWNNPGYTTLSVTTTGAEKCITLEESLALLSHKLAEGVGAGTLNDTAAISEGATTLVSAAWEVDHPGEVEEVDLPNLEEVARITWSCHTPGAIGTYVVTSHGLVGPTITSSGQFGSVSASWCATAKKREARERRRKEEQRKRESAQYRREKPKRETEERRAKAKEQQEDFSSTGGEGRAERAAEHVVSQEGHKMFDLKCRRIGPSEFYCKFEEPPQYNGFHATVTFDGHSTYVGPVEPAF